MAREDEELLAEWLLRWEEARELGRGVSVSELVGERPDLAAELERRIRILDETAWLDEPLDDEPLERWPGSAAGHDRNIAPTLAAGTAASDPPDRTPAARRRCAGLMPLAFGLVCLAGLAGGLLFFSRQREPAGESALSGDRLTQARQDFFHARYAEAEAGFTAALATTPDDREALMARGISRLKLGRFDEAIADFTKTLEQAPGDREALRQRAQASIYLKRYDEAIGDLERLRASGIDADPIRQQIAALRAARAAGPAGAANAGDTSVESTWAEEPRGR